MFKSRLLVVILIMAFVLSACTPATPAPATLAPVDTQASVATQASTATQAPTVTQAPTEPGATATTAPPATAAAPSYSESPMLTDLVKAGKLPPIEQRLPLEPFIVGPGTLITKTDLPDWQPGKYGGTMHFANASANWNPDIFIMANENLLCAPGIGLEGLEPCILKSYKIENDNKVFTFVLRKGLKWSDGIPVTTEDVRFVYEDQYQNEKLNPTFPIEFRAGGDPNGEPMKLDIVDDYTFRLTSTKPYGGLLREISIKGWHGYTDLLQPAHYLKAYHIKYTTIDKFAADLKRLNLTNGEWWQVFADKRCLNWDMTNPKCADYPTLNPWVPTVSGSPQTLTFTRNPYYWKVDTKGQQLPYVDKLVSQQVNDVEALTLKVLGGDVDYVRESTALVKLPLYKQNADKAGFKVTLMDNHVDPTALFINYTYADANFRKVVNDIRFRQAVNFAINRKEIIDNVYFGLASLPATVPNEYSVDKANKLLDDMGMDKKDADGYRLGPDGKTFNILLEHGAWAPDIAPAVDLLVAQLKAVGIKVTAKQEDPNLVGTKQAANQTQATVIWDVQPMWKNGTWTDYTPQTNWGTLWMDWYNSAGKKGEEPPADIKQLYTDNEGRTAAVPGSAEDIALTADIYKILSNDLWIIPLAEKVSYAMISSSKLGNVPISGQAIGANYSGEEFFFK
jgi:peptide/nickel transport system substrate-binding protein